MRHLHTLALISALMTTAQSQSFEVASVRENLSTEQPVLQYHPGGRFVARNVPLGLVVASAYDLPYGSPRLTGNNDWSLHFARARYNIQAAAPKGAVPDGASSSVRDRMTKLMLQALLADRFGLVLSRDPKEQPVYALTVDRRGPKLDRSAVTAPGCNSGPTSVLFDPKGCHGIAGSPERGLRGAAVTMDDIASYLQNFTDRPVIDRTRLSGLYDFRTEPFTGLRANQEGNAIDRDPDRATLLDALARLRLRLVSERAVVEMFFVSHVERPTEN